MSFVWTLTWYSTIIHGVGEFFLFTNPAAESVKPSILGDLDLQQEGSQSQVGEGP